jgi:soluble lytic murein transglycosylase-like protein
MFDDSSFKVQLQTTIYQMIFNLLQRMEGGASNRPANGLLSSVSSTSGASASGSTASGVSSTTGAPVQGNFADLINKAAQKYGVNPQLVNAVIKAESNFNPRATSYCGAAGLMQLMPATARSLGVTDIYDPAQNIEGGVKFLSGLLSHFHGNTQLAVAAYNAGPGAVDRYGGIPPYSETQTYVKRVMGYFQTNNQWSG